MYSIKLSDDALARIDTAMEDLRKAIDAAVKQSVADPTVDKPLAKVKVFPDSYFVDYGLFFEGLRSKKMFGEKLDDPEWRGCEAIIKAFTKSGAPISYCAYGLATAYLETQMTMQPVLEAFWLSPAARERWFFKMYDIKGSRPSKARELENFNPGDGAKYAGRGYVQLTGGRNYRVLTERLRKAGYDVDLVNKPDDAMKPDIAAAIMTIGMIEGLFTGRKLSDDLPASGPASFTQFEDSRDIINGKDRQAEIARYAIDFQTFLLHAGYHV